MHVSIFIDSKLIVIQFFVDEQNREATTTRKQKKLRFLQDTILNGREEAPETSPTGASHGFTTGYILMTARVFGDPETVVQ